LQFSQLSSTAHRNAAAALWAACRRDDSACASISNGRKELNGNVDEQSRVKRVRVLPRVDELPDLASPVSTDSTCILMREDCTNPCDTKLDANLAQILTTALLHTDMNTQDVSGHDASYRAFSDCAIWEGSVKHKLPTSTSELFGLSMAVPVDLIESFPQTLFVSNLAPASHVMPEAGDLEAHCGFADMSPEHAQTARKMVETELCVCVNLQDCQLWICPTISHSGKLEVCATLRRTM